MSRSDAAKTQTGAVAVADLLAGYGVSHVFMVPAILRQTFVELEFRHPEIARVATHGEKSAAYMADGYARASGRPGVCAAQIVGALNLAAGLRDAWLAHSPVIAFTGGRSPETKFRTVYQEVDDLPAFDNVTKLNATIDDVSRFPDMIRQAFRVATSGSPGPVHLQVQGNEGQIDQRTAELDATAEPQFAQLPPFRPQAEEGALRAALAALQEARRPVIVAGGGVRASGAAAELVRLAEALGVPVATSANGRDSISGRHPLSLGVVGTYARETANLAVGRADLVCFVGTAAGGMTTHFWQVPPPGTRAVQIDIDPEVIGRNYPVEVGVLGDARSVLRRMAELADPATAALREDWRAEVAAIRSDWADRYREVMSSDASPMRPERLCRELAQLLPSDAQIVVDTGHAGMWMAQFFDLTSARQSYLRSAGHLGWAFPAGLGAQCASPERRTVVFTGDAGLYYHLGELETAVRWNMKAITVVNNNVGGTQSRKRWEPLYRDRPRPEANRMWTYRDVELAEIANTMGALGIRVDRPAQLGPAIERALETDGPVVIDARTAVEADAPQPVVA